jgi:hypothetical protein
MRYTRKRSQFEMTSRAALDEAADWLRELGYGISVNPSAALRPGRQQLVIFHPTADAREIRRIVFIVDPRAIERQAPAGR